ncbi:MAG: 2-hydroxyacyl-CoA dehydratase family protein [Dehalococcoidia bacterium]|nr:2-hydroxyacyl-CoA dehydratase family protein [Dehalococcoidia bacterium]
MRSGRNLAQELAGTFGGVAARTASKRPEDAWLYEARAGYWKRLLSAREQGKGIAWVSFCAVPEIFWAMDLVPWPMEATFGILTGLPKGITEYLDIADRFVSDHVCAANRSMIGAAVAGDLGLPDVIIHASKPCDSALSAFSNVAEYLGVPHFCVDIPYWQDDATFEYLGHEIENLVAFLEEQTGRRMDFDRLKEVIRYSNQAHEYYRKINELRKLKPCPVPSIMLGHNAGSFMTLAGTPELVEYARAQYELGAARVSRGEGQVPDEKLRLGWVYVPVMHDPGLFEWLEREFGAVVAMDMIANYVNTPVEDVSSPKAIYRGLAEKMANLPMVRESRGPMEYHANAVIELCRDYHCDAAIFSGHMGCKHGWAIAKLIKDKVKEALGIPMLVFDVDCFDPRVASPATVRSRIGDFLSLL